MSEPVIDFLNRSGLTQKKPKLIFNRGFLSRNSVVVPYDKMPKQYRNYLDDLAVSVFDPEGGKVIVTGSPMVGKTFFIDQLYANRSVFMQRSSGQPIEFVYVPKEHAILVDNFLAGKWHDYIELTTRTFNTDFSHLVYVTESVDAAVGLSNLQARIILETSISTLQQLQNHERSGIVKQWSSWEIMDINDALLSRSDMVQSISEALLPKINATYPILNLSKKHVALFVNRIAKRGELVIDSETDPFHAGMLCVQPGLMARAFYRLASIMALSSDVLDKSGKIVFSRAVDTAYEDFEGLFISCLRKAIQRAKEPDDEFFDGELNEALKDFLEENVPEVKIMSFQSLTKKAKDEKEKEKKEKEWKYSNLSTLEDRLGKTILGQDNALHEVVEGLKIPAAGLNIETKPLRSLLFLGPTGVGKTQLALSLAKELMTEELPIIRIDMSEFGREHEASKLLGAPPGYVGHEEGGILTNFVEQNPQCLVILDEIEKAHPKIWDSFLQVLDAGRMTDGQGNVTDFTKTIIIMTSNLGADQLSKPLTGFNYGTAEELYAQRERNSSEIIKKAVETTFRPELVNRIDQQVVFHELPKAILRTVIAREINLATERISHRGYVLEEPKTDILDHIANMADASKYGAREVQRVVGRNVYGLLADTVLADREKKGLKLVLRNGQLKIQERKIG